MEFKDSHSKRTKDYWTYLEDNYKEVASWPTWMRGEASSPSERAQSESEEEQCIEEQNDDTSP